MSQSNTHFPMDHLVILVSDMNRSLHFYGTLLPLLGFHKTSGMLFANAQGITFDFRQAVKTATPYERYAPGLNHIGFTAASREQIEAVLEHMRTQGFAVPEIQNLEGDQAIFFKDPDGMRIELTAYAGGLLTAET